MDDRQEGAAHSFPPNAVHLVRTNQQLTMQLSQMADQKASILMGATFVVFTLAIGQARAGAGAFALPLTILATFRSEEHTSELQSLMRTSYAVFCLNKKNN